MAPMETADWRPDRLSRSEASSERVAFRVWRELWRVSVSEELDRPLAMTLGGGGGAEEGQSGQTE